MESFFVTSSRLGSDHGFDLPKVNLYDEREVGSTSPLYR